MSERLETWIVRCMAACLFLQMVLRAGLVVFFVVALSLGIWWSTK